MRSNPPPLQKNLDSLSNNKSSKSKPTEMANQSNQLTQQQKQIFANLQKVNFPSLSSLQSVLTDMSSFDAYVKAIKQNKHQFNNKIVLHLASQCNCMYSIFAAEAGAKKVYCILNGHSQGDVKNARMMKQIIQQNGYQDIISVQLYKDFKIQGKVDIIIGQPMGCNLIYDGMIDRMIDARDLFLDQENGIMMPDRIRYKCALIWDQYQIDEKVEYWNEVYGVTMKEMKKWVAQELYVGVVDPTLIITEVVKLFQFDLYKTSYDQIDQIHKTLHIKPLGQQVLKANGLAMWFQVDFTQADGDVITIDASPWSQETRWSHVTLYTKNEWKLEKGQSKKIKFSAKKSHLHGKVTIKLKIDDKDEVFVMC